MSFYERYEMLCAERDMKPQNAELQKVAGVTSGSISGWKKGASPKIEVLCRLSAYFQVSTDFLLGISEIRNPASIPSLTEKERLLIEAYRCADAQGQLNIAYVCMDEKRKASEKNASQVG